MICAPSTTSGSGIMPALSLPPAQPMFSYVNPAFTNFRNHDVSVPPPVVGSSSAWTGGIHFNTRNIIYNLLEILYKVCVVGPNIHIYRKKLKLYYLRLLLNKLKFYFTC